MEPRFGHDFSHVQVHTDARAAESAQAVSAVAYTVGRDIVFAAGQYAPHTKEGQRLIAHELTHVVQQGSLQPAPMPARNVVRNDDGGYRIAVAPVFHAEPDNLEHQADAVADLVTDESKQSSQDIAQHLEGGNEVQSAIQRVRVPLPISVPLCGKTLTHIDIEPPRARPLVPCLPPTVLVTRINIVGRDLSVPVPGRGPQVFNLHIGYFTDPATGRYCAIADDSKTCVASRCVMLGCFPTLKEVLDAIIEFLKDALIVLGIIALLILIALIIELLGPILAPAGALAAAEGGEAGGPGEAVAATGGGAESGEEAEA